jgi:signal transduction histidine kinase
MNSQQLTTWWVKITAVGHNLPPSEREKAQLLAGLLFALILPGLPIPILALIQYQVGWDIQVWVGWAGWLVLVLIYLLNRYGYFPLTLWGTLVLVTSGIFALAILVGHDTLLFLYLLTPIFMFFALLELRQALGLTIGLLALLGSVFVFVSLPLPRIEQLNILVFLTLLTGLLSIFVVYVRRTESARRVQLETANKELEQFAYVAAHDLKAPLRGISNLAQWLQEDLETAVTPEMERYFALLHGRVHRMEAIINGLRQYAHATEEKGHRETIDLAPLAHELFAKTTPPDPFKLVVQTSLPPFTSEKGRLSQIIFQLFDNAVRHRERDDGRVILTAQRQDSHYHFTISDNGPGIDPRYHDKAFAIFQTLVARDEKESVGIGLALVKKLIEAQGGEIRLESAVGQGTTIRFTWPA